MIVTFTSHKNVSAMEQAVSRHSNIAGVPLPSIPRRPSTGSHPRPAPQLLETHSPVKAVLQQCTPPSDSSTPTMTSPIINYDSSSSTNSDNSPPTIRRQKNKRRGSTPAICPPEHSTPTPSLFNSRSNQENQMSVPFPSIGRHVNGTVRPGLRPLMYTPGIPLRQQVERPKARNFSESHASSRSSPEVPTLTTSASAIISKPNLIRKKSGEPVKSSMKSSKSLTIITPAFRVKNEPMTPTHQKAVHFDAQLEHVKLFLAEQKPLAVSRDGSPTDDSCTDSDFPSFIFGDSKEKISKKAVTMHLHNMPDQINLTADIALEGLALAFDGLSINGRVRVRNIAYSKAIAVRFTFDNWQTTSEVVGKFLESAGKNFDRFTFSIRLNDLLARIETKQLFLAVRYSVAGKEFWDNNYGMNYLVEFKRATPPPKPAPPVTVTAVANANKSLVSPTSSLIVKDDLADLKSELEKFVKSREDGLELHSPSSTTSTPTPATIRPLPLSGSNPENEGFAARYKFDVSDTTPWRPSDFSPARHLRTTTHPALKMITPPTASPIPWPEKVKARGVPIIMTIPILGSPRDLDDEALFASPRTAVVDGDMKPSYFRLVGHTGFRNHRRGSFDETAFAAAKVKRTPPATPFSELYPPLDITPLASHVPAFPSCKEDITMQGEVSPGTGFGSALPSGLGLRTSYFDSQPGDSSELSTPSFISPTSSSSPSSASSPTQSFLEHSSAEVTASSPGSIATISPKTSYRQFLNKFCFFTGLEEFSLMNIPEDPIPCTQSASDIEDLLSSTTPHLHFLDSCTSNTPARSPSFDDLVVRSGSSTPTSHSLQAIHLPLSPVSALDTRLFSPILA